MNKRYVDIDKFKKQIQKAIDNYWLGFSNGYYLAEDVIEDINYNNFDLADVEEVRHGIWLVAKIERAWNDAEYPFMHKCSLCNNEVASQDLTLYCPYCGAKMTEETNNEKV